LQNHFDDASALAIEAPTCRSRVHEMGVTYARNRDVVTCVGVKHRTQLSVFETRGGCIARQHEGVVLRRGGGLHRPQFRPAKCVFQLMAQVCSLWAALVTNDEPT
jgi:hypothetical protein